MRNLKSMEMKKQKKYLKIIALTIAAVLMLAGCGNANSPAADKDSSSVDQPEVVNIGTQQLPNDEMLAIAKGYFEEELGVKVNIVEFQAGDIRNAMISKDIDFAMLGSSSATLGIANGMDVELIWIHEILGDAEMLVVRNGSDIQSIQDLKGKKIAAPFTSTAHYSLLRALKLNGISESDVTLLDMQMPDLYAAWQRGDIDAAYAWEPTLSSLLEDGSIILSSKDMAEQGIVTANVEIVRREFAEEYPQIVEKYIKALNRAVQLYREHQAEAVAAIADTLEITDEEALKQTQGSIWLDAEQQLDSDYLGTSSQKGNMVNSLNDMADFLYEQKSLVSKPEESRFEQVMNPYYVEEALKKIADGDTE